jgi:hypothetical protein
MEPVYGIHLGLVVSDNPDPEGRNRVQVWIPHLSSTLYSSINQKLKDLNIKSPGDLPSEALTKLRQILPWAEYGAPLFGGSSGNFNAATGKTATSGSSTLPDTTGVIPPSFPSTNPNMNLDGTKPKDDQSPSYAASVVGNLAAQYVGTSYHQGISMQCANWVNNVLGQAGLPTSGSDSAASFANMGTQITDINQVQPGDVVILRSTASNSGYHAGLAALDPNSGSLVFTSKPGANSPITENDFNGSYVQNKFAYAVRLDGSGGSSQNTAQNNQQQNYTPTQNIIHTARTANKVVAGNTGTSGSAVGSFTTPNAGSKVWVFFMGGDIQRPVYFAQAVNTGDVKASVGA